MKTDRKVIDRITFEYEPGDDRPKIYNPYHPAFYIVPDRIIAEFSSYGGSTEERPHNAIVIGQRYRVMKDKTVEVGPKRDSRGPTTWDFHISVPDGLARLLSRMRWAA